MNINPEYFFVFVLTGAALAAAPGPNLLFIVSQSLRAGFVNTTPAAAGMVFASLSYAVLAVTGAAVVLEMFPILLVLAKVFGAAYLCYLAVRQWRGAGFTFPNGQMEMVSGTRNFCRGMLVGLSNPKTMLFYLTFIPQFLDPNLPFTEQLVIYNFTQLGILATVTFGYSAMANSLRQTLQDQRRVKRLNQFAAGILILAALLMVGTLVVG